MSEKLNDLDLVLKPLTAGPPHPWFPNAFLIRLNRDDLQGMPENPGSTITFDEDMKIVINDIGFM
jgi:hypothetical protein